MKQQEYTQMHGATVASGKVVCVCVTACPKYWTITFFFEVAALSGLKPMNALYVSVASFVFVNNVK